VIKFLILEKQSVNNFHERLTNVYGGSGCMQPSPDGR